MDTTLLYLIIGFALSALYFEFRVRRFMSKGPAALIQRVLDDFFDEGVTKDAQGVEHALLRPNARLEAFLQRLLPGLIEWGGKHVKFNLGDVMKNLQLPNATAEELGGALMGGLAQKALSGKKLKGEDLLQGFLGLVLPKIQGMVGGLGGLGTQTKPGEKPKPAPAADVREEMHR